MMKEMFLCFFLCYISLFYSQFYHDQCHYVPVVTQPVRFLTYSSCTGNCYSFSGQCLLVACMGMLCSIVTLALFIIINCHAFLGDCVNAGSVTGVILIITLAVFILFECLCSFSFLCQMVHQIISFVCCVWWVCL